VPIPRLSGGLPLLGHLLEFRRDRLALMLRLARECGGIGRFDLGPRAVYVVADAELAGALLGEHADAFEKGPVVRRFARPVLGDGLIAAPNTLHRKRRRLVASALSGRIVERHAHASVAAAEASAAALARRAGGPVDVAEEMTRLTLRAIGETLCSVDLTGEESALADAMTLVLRHVTGLIERPLPVPLSIPTPGNRRVRRAVATLDRQLARMIARRRTGEASDADHPIDLLGALTSASVAGDAPLDDREVRDEAMNLFVAGHETTATALAWTLGLLTQDPAARARLDEELARVLAGRTPTLADLSRLVYTQQVLRESLRLHPPVHTIGRQASRPVEVDGLRFAAGAIVAVSPLLLHRRADYFPEPQAFRPERFAAGAAERIPRHAYLPFGAGPRVCVGAQLASTASALALATLCQRLSFEWPGGPLPEPEMLITLRPKGGMRLAVRRR
jgi:cytochrome P450